MRIHRFVIWCLGGMLWAGLVASAAAEPIAVVVHPSNAQTEFNTSSLSRVYSGEMEQWPDGKKIVALNRPIDSEIRRRFYTRVLEAEPTAKFFAPGSPIPFKTRKVSSDRAVRKMVARIPNAIGYLALSEVDETVKILTIDGLPPGQPGYPIE